MERNLPTVQEAQVRSLGWEDLLEKGMSARSSILAWRIPWTEEPGGLQSMIFFNVFCLRAPPVLSGPCWTTSMTKVTFTELITSLRGRKIPMNISIREQNVL